MATDVLPSIAARYQLSERTVRTLYDSLQSTQGMRCEFDCPELGGSGQWSPGMVVLAAPSDRLVRSRIDGLCCELAAIVRGSDTAAPQALSRPPGTAPAVGHMDLVAGESWWPASFGHPASHGEQCGVRFAFFPHTRRLLVQKGAHIEAYETRDYIITGLAEVQGPSSLTFDSNRGPVHLDQLQCVRVA